MWILRKWKIGNIIYIQPVWSQYNVLHIFEKMWFSMGRNVRKWVSSSTSELHNWQILWLSGVFGLLYQPVSSYKGRHLHLIWAIVLLLFREMAFRMYPSGWGQDLYSLQTASLPPLSESVGCLQRSSYQPWNSAAPTVSHSIDPGTSVTPVTPTSLISLWVQLLKSHSERFAPKKDFMN